MGSQFESGSSLGQHLRNILPQRLRPLRGRKVAPCCPVERAAGRRNSTIHIRGLRLGDGGKLLAGGGVLDPENLAALGLHPPASDEELLRLVAQEFRYVKVFGDGHGSMVRAR